MSCERGPPYFLQNGGAYYKPFFLECQFSIQLNQFHWKHKPMKRMNPAPSTSANAVKNELCGDKPAVAIDSIVPSKLQGTINLEDLMPSKAFLATSSAFIPPEDPAMILVRSGRLLCSVFSKRSHVIIIACFRKTFEIKCYDIVAMLTMVKWVREHQVHCHILRHNT